MTLDPSQRRLPSSELPTLRVGQPKAADAPGLLERAADAVDDALAPIDHFKDRLDGELKETADAIEARAGRVPVLGQAVQFLRGAAGALLATAEGTYQMVRHPIQTVQGLWSMLSHVPLSPPWVYRAVREGLGATLQGDGMFWKAVGSGMLEPYRKDWSQGRYFAVAGRAAAEIGMLYLSARQAKRAYDAWKGRRQAAEAVDEVARASSATADDGLKAAVLGDDGMRASGQVIGEGEVMVGGNQKTVSAVREELEKARRSFTGNRQEVRARVGARVETDVNRVRRLDQVGPKRLATDASVKRRFRLVTDSVDKRMDAEIQQLLGHMPEGTPKNPLRAAAKLEELQAVSGPKIRLGDMDDLARGRINLPSHDVPTIRDMVKKLRTHYGDSNLMINDYMRGKPFYRGRIHVKIRDVSGMWYELQIGSKQLSTFFDTKFAMNAKLTNVHDAIYKGIMLLDDDAIKLLGKGSVRAGTKRVAEVLNLYVKELDEVLATAGKGHAYDFVKGAGELRQAVRDLVKELPSHKLPIGLQ